MNRRPPSRIEVMFLASELDRFLSGGRVSNIYCNAEPGFTLLKVNTADGTRRLIYERGLRACLTDFLYPFPRVPSPQIKAAKKAVRGSRVVKVNQERFDRVISIDLSSREGEAQRIMLETLPGGVLAILNEDEIVTYTTERKVMRDRSIVLGEKYQLPPRFFPSPMHISEDELLRILEGGRELRSALEADLGLGNLSEVVWHAAGLDATDVPGSLSREGASRILEEVRKTIGSLVPRPVVYSGDSGPEEYSLVPLPHPPAPTWNQFETISEAMDWYYSGGGKLTLATAPAPDRKSASKKRAAERLLLQSVKLRGDANLVMADLARFERILSLVKEGRRGRVEEGVDLKGVDYEEGTARLAVNGHELQLDLSRSVAANASMMFERSKALRARAERLSAESEKAKPETKTAVIKLKRVRRRLWYEKFKWALLSSSRKLLLGRDATTNEILVTRHADEKAQVFHSDFSGSPFAIAWPPGEMTEKEIREAADLTACYTSKAWEMGFSSLDVYWVRGTQLSKSPPSGTYLRKGSFFVSGSKNFIRGAKLSLGIGVSVSELGINVYAGHPSAIAGGLGIVLAPGRHDNSIISKRISKAISTKYSRRLVGEMIEAIRERLPNKRSEIVSIKGL